jgi:hypothetical protein
MDGTGSHSRTLEYFDYTLILSASNFRVKLPDLVVCEASLLSVLNVPTCNLLSVCLVKRCESQCTS